MTPASCQIAVSAAYRGADAALGAMLTALSHCDVAVRHVARANGEAAVLVDERDAARAHAATLDAVAPRAVTPRACYARASR